MREIKFRTWNPKHNYFEYWGFYNDDIDNKPYFKGTPSGGGFVSNQILENTDQYTGLKDKNGVEIYEGDILSEGNVYFDNNMLGFFVDGDGEYDRKPLYDISLPEVIGNIHQSPELLK